MLFLSTLISSPQNETEEMLMLGEEKYHMQMNERVQEAAIKYGFAIDRRRTAYPAPTCFEKITEAKRT